MPDPQRDIAPIIEPVAPPLPPAGPDYTWPVALAVGGLLLLAVLVWAWRRRAPLRSLRRIARASDPIAGANALAALVAQQSLRPPRAWEEELEMLRFGPPADYAGDVLARLCQGAEHFLKAR
jgi:hypothetical protein